MKVNTRWLQDHGLTQEDIDEYRHSGPDVMGGVTLPGDNPERSVTTAPPPPPSQSDRARAGIDIFSQRLGEINPQFFEIGQGLIDQGLGTGTNPLIEAQRGRAQDQFRAQAQRSGISGGVLANQQARIGQGFDERALASRGTALKGGLSLQQSALQNLLAEPTAETALLTAQRSGEGGGGKK